MILKYLAEKGSFVLARGKGQVSVTCSGVLDFWVVVVHGRL